ncbi:MAG: hypothetical protein ACOCVC_06255, partial [Spirochaeta sp.]
MQHAGFLHRAVKTLYGLGIGAFLIISGCATLDPADRAAPDWVRQRPAADAEYEYFVGFGMDEAGIQSRAEEAATYGMIAEIIRYIGVEITAETNATARSNLDSFEAELVEQVQQRGEAVVSGFQVVDSYVYEQEGQVMVYLLGRYERSQLEAEQERFRLLFQERIDAVDVPERRGMQLLESGRYGAALPFLLQAAAAAAVSDIDNAGIRFDRNMVAARRIVQNLVLEPTVQRVSAAVHEPVSQPIEVYAYYQHDGRREP